MWQKFVGLLVVSGLAIAVFAMPNPQERVNGPTAVPGQPQQSLTAIPVRPGSVGRRFSADRPLIGRRYSAPKRPLLTKPLPAGLLPAQPGSKIAIGKHAGAITRLAPRLMPTAGEPIYLRTIAPGSVRPFKADMRPSDGAKRRKLVRNLQRELQRVGCYAGKIHGLWGPGTRRAMSRFIANANAALPVHEPDEILLSLVQGQRSTVCGSTCRHRSQASLRSGCRPAISVGRHPRTPKSAVQRTAGAGTIAKAGVAPIIRGVVTPMAGVRVPSPASIPMARPDTRDLGIIATRAPSGLGQGRAGVEPRSRVQGRKPPNSFRQPGGSAAFWSRLDDTAN